AGQTAQNVTDQNRPQNSDAARTRIERIPHQDHQARPEQNQRNPLAQIFGVTEQQQLTARADHAQEQNRKQRVGNGELHRTALVAPLMLNSTASQDQSVKREKPGRASTPDARTKAGSQLWKKFDRFSATAASHRRSRPTPNGGSCRDGRCDRTKPAPRALRSHRSRSRSDTA